MTCCPIYRLVYILSTNINNKILKIRSMIRLFKDPFFGGIDGVLENVYTSFTYPKTHVDKTDDGYKITVTLPGLSKEDLKVQVKDKKLTISYENEKNESDSNFIENFSKTYILSDDILDSKITADMKNGILVIKLPTTDVNSKTKVIEIK